MGGIFLGFACAVLLLAVFGRLRAAHAPRGWLGRACWALIALTGLDGLNAFFFDGNLPHLYAPTTVLRLLTGLGAGLGLGWLAVPAVASVVWRRPRDEAAVEEPVELLGGLAVIGLLGGVILVSPSALLWPLALAMLASVLLAFGCANLYLLVLATGRAAERFGDLHGLLLSSLGGALLEIGALAAL